MVRPARAAAEALLAGAARATGRGLSVEHLSVLDGTTLNLAVVVSDVATGDAVTVEFGCGTRRANAEARTVAGPDGRTRVEATVRLRSSGTHDLSATAGHVPGVTLDPGIWNIHLVINNEEERRVPLAAPVEVGDPTSAQHAARFSVTGTLSGTAALAVRSPRPAAYVRTVLVRPHCARVTGDLVDAGPVSSLTAELARCDGETVQPVQPVLSPGSRGSEFTVVFPLRAMADSAADSGSGGQRWGLWFHTADGTRLRARRERVAPEATLVRPAQVVRPDKGPPMLVLPYYTASAVLVISVTTPVAGS